MDYKKKLLKEMSDKLFDTDHESGLPSIGRLHRSLIEIESMSPKECNTGGKNLSVNYSFADSTFGNILIASTLKGICYCAFADEKRAGLTLFENYLPNAKFKEHLDEIQQNALNVFSSNLQNISQIKLHLKGTEFQFKVWEALLKIPMGELSTYGSIAKQIDKPKASRAVGTAIGSNPVAFLIPCHRVIQSSGKLGGYMWGLERKSKIIDWESQQIKNQ